MKVNLNANFSEVSRFLAATAQPKPAEQATGAFSNLLSSLNSLLDEKPQKRAEMPESDMVKQGARNAGPGPLASFSFRAPSTMPPPVGRQVAPTEIVSPPVNSVKTPSLLEAKRVPVAYLPPAIEKNPEVGLAQIKAIVRDAGVRHGVDPALSMAVASAESGFDQDAVSSDGFESKGVFQLLDSTAQTMLRKVDGMSGPYQPFNPQMNVDLGVRYLRYLHDLFSKESELPNNISTVAAANSSSLEKLAVAAFNAGEGRVASAQQHAIRLGKDAAQYDEIKAYLPESTREYVQRVMTVKSRFGDTVVG